MQRHNSETENLFLGHPRGLLVCFLTELWERFSYYGMRALLILYLTKHFLFGDNQALHIFAAYSAMVYLMPVIGGILADRYLGARKAVVFGAILLVLGHFGMALEGPAAYTNESGEVERESFYLQTFYLSLALIISGVGFLKANISTIVGALYQPGDPRRDSGFTLFYMGINIGAFAATILCGWLGEAYGWAYGFGLAGIGMLLGLTTFLRGQVHLGGRAEPPAPERLRERVLPGISIETAIYLASAIGVLVVWQLMQHRDLIGQLLQGTGGIMLVVILFFAFTRCTPVERDRMLVITALIGFSVVFWSLFEQAGSSLNLFADRFVDRQMFDREIPASVFQSINPFFIFLLAPLFSLLWIRLAARNLEPSTPVKFSLAIFQVGLGFLALVYGAHQADSATSVGLWWLVLIYLLHTSGELCLSPVGLSAVTKLSVPRIVGMMMGVWFLASAGAGYIAGEIARLTGAETVNGEIVNAEEALANSIEIYTKVGGLAMLIAAVLLVTAPLLKRRMHGIQ